MKRTHSTMTAAELEAWRARHGLDKRAAAAKLGVSERMIYRYIQEGQPISETVAKLCEALEDVKKYRRCAGYPDE